MISNVLCAVNNAVSGLVLKMNILIAGAGSGAASVLEGGEGENTSGGTGLDVEELLTKKGAEEGSLSGIKDLVVSYGAGSFNIIQILLIYVVATAVVGTIIALIFNASNPNKVSEKKNALIIIFAAAVVGFAVTSIIVFASNMGATLLK